MLKIHRILQAENRPFLFRPFILTDLDPGRCIGIGAPECFTFRSCVLFSLVGDPAELSPFFPLPFSFESNFFLFSSILTSIQAPYFRPLLPPTGVKERERIGKVEDGGVEEEILNGADRRKWLLFLSRRETITHIHEIASAPPCGEGENTTRARDQFAAGDARKKLFLSDMTYCDAVKALP